MNESSLPQKKSSLTSNVRWACTFTIAFVGYLFISKPATTPASLAFRLTLVFGSIAGLAVVTFYDWRGKQVPSRSN